MTLVVFGISCEGSIGIVIAVTLLQGVAGMCYGKRGYDSKKTYMEIGFNYNFDSSFCAFKISILPSSY